MYHIVVVVVLTAVLINAPYLFTKGKKTVKLKRPSNMHYFRQQY